MTITDKSITFIKPDDMHLHIRQDLAAINYIKESARQCARALIMPNTKPPVTTLKEIETYREFILNNSTDFEPLMSCKLLPDMSVSLIKELKENGVIAGKYYPAGATTNAEDGATNIKQLYPVFDAMQELQLPLSIHGEDPSVLCTQREEAFLPQLYQLNKDFPNLSIILEHISSKAAVDAILELPQTIAATITVHHLYLTLDDVVTNPHNLCMPIAKTREDREAVRQAALSGNTKFFFGSDSAPHLQSTKEQIPVSAGIFSAPAAIPLLAQFFEEQHSLEKMENFTSRFGADFYQIEQNNTSITLVKEPFQIAEIYYGVVPFMAGKTITWSIAK